MVFSSEIFLFGFLPLFLAVYFATPFRRRSLVILIGSYVFYGWWRIDFLALLFGTTFFAYVIGQKVYFYRAVPKGKLYLRLGVIGCLLVLGVFKYLNFFVDSLAQLVGSTPEDLGLHWQIILPIGISFYVFQAISYLIDLSRSDARPARNFLDFAAFIALFPQLIAGPILRYKDLEKQFRHRPQSLDCVSAGLAIFLIGLGKKVLIADSLAPLVDAGFDAEAPTAALAWAAALAFALQLYFDFSGYSDMAIGLGRMMGFTFPQNFRFPYWSRSITEFWRRWHISLSTWLRDYLYIPLGGNQNGATRTYINLMLVMLIGGLWHGANWTFVIWGLWHGGLLAVERLTGWMRVIERIGAAQSVTFLFVLMGWVVFRAENVSQAIDIYQGMIGGNGLVFSPQELRLVTRESLLVAMIAVAVVWIEPFLASPRKSHPVASNSYLPNPVRVQSALNPIAVLVGGFAILKLAEQSFSPFLYFQF